MSSKQASASSGDWSAPDAQLANLEMQYLQGASDRALQPFLYNFNPSDIQNLGANLSTVNAQKSRELEKMFSPSTVQIRDEIPKQLFAALTGNDPLGPLLERYAVQAGLQDALGSGLNTGTGQSMGNAHVANVLGKSVLDRYQQNLSNAGNYLAANPAPMAGLDPGSLVSLFTQNQGDIANVYNQGVSNVGNLQGGVVQNRFNALQQDKQRTATMAANNANAANSNKGSGIGMFASLLSPIASIATAPMTGGGSLAGFAASKLFS